MSSTDSAPESALGYLHQFETALFLLLKNPDIAIGIEHIDDISFTRNENLEEAIQLKHHIRNHGNITDSSTDLWKTIGNWITGINDNTAPKNIVRTLITTASASANSIAELLSPQQEKRNVEEAQIKLQRIARESSSTTNRQYYENFTQFGEINQKSLLETVKIITSSPNFAEIQTEINKILNIFVRKEHRNQFYERLWGWWVNSITDKFVKHEKAIISYDELSAQIQDIRDQFSQENLPIDFATVQPDNSLSFRDRLFVKQLEWVRVGDERINLAILDYWRAYQQKSKWVRDELLFDNELDKYELRLIDAWRRRFLIMRDELSASASNTQKEIKGREVYNWAETTTELCIRERCTEPYVTRGSFHMLANKKEIGWHIDFIEKIRALTDRAEGVTV